MRPKEAEEKLRVMDIIRENAALVLSIGGFVYIIFQFVIIPINNLQYQVGDILNNHLKTIQDALVSEAALREQETEKMDEMAKEIVKLETLLSK